MNKRLAVYLAITYLALSSPFVLIFGLMEDSKLGWLLGLYFVTAPIIIALSFWLIWRISPIAIRLFWTYIHLIERAIGIRPISGLCEKINNAAKARWGS